MKKQRKTAKPAGDSAPIRQDEQIPAGARIGAFHRPENEEHGPGSGAGPRHAANDPGSPDEEYGAVDSNAPAAEPDHEPDPSEEEGYGGFTGGAVGGAIAGGRSRGGRVGHGITPAEHRGDSTIGADPNPDEDSE